MIATGESGHIFSSHYGDLTPLWNDVQIDHDCGIGERSSSRLAREELTLKP